MDGAKLLYLGHSTVLVITETGKRVIIDPWLSGNPRCPEQYHNLDDIQLICLTHGHGDHTGSAVELAQQTGALVAATYELGALLTQDGVPENQILPMNKGGTVQIPQTALKVTLTNAFHSSSYTTADGVTHYAGEACGIILHMESGATIYHAGDTCLFGGMEMIGRRYRPQVALVPIGDCFTMGPEDAAEAVRLIRATTVVPVHYETFPLLTGTAEEFRKCCATTDATIVVLQPGQDMPLNSSRQ